MSTANRSWSLWDIPGTGFLIQRAVESLWRDCNDKMKQSTVAFCFSQGLLSYPTQNSTLWKIKNLQHCCGAAVLNYTHQQLQLYSSSGYTVLHSTFVCLSLCVSFLHFSFSTGFHHHLSHLLSIIFTSWPHCPTPTNQRAPQHFSFSNQWAPFLSI